MSIIVQHILLLATAPVYTESRTEKSTSKDIERERERGQVRKPTTTTTTNGRWMLINNSKQLHYKCHQLCNIAKLMRIYDNIWSLISNTVNHTKFVWVWPVVRVQIRWHLPLLLLLLFSQAAASSNSSNIYIYTFDSVWNVHFIINASETRNTIDFLLRWKVNDTFNTDFYSLGTAVGLNLHSVEFTALLVHNLFNINLYISF